MKHKGIKDLRPSKKSRYKQGYINPDSCKKLFESQQEKPIIYRSSWEKQFVQWLEASPHVLRWGSECVKIDYIDPYDNKPHHYYPDYLVETDKGLMLVEVKPHNQTVPPDPLVPESSWVMRTWIKNKAKWKAAILFCRNNDMMFKIVTEKTLKRII